MPLAPQPPTAQSPPAPAVRPGLTLAAVALGLMMVMLDSTVVSIANPTIGRDLGASLPDLQWVTNGYLLAVATGVITGGKLGDRFGRKRVFLTGVSGFALASLLCALSGSIGMLIGARVLQGLFGALLLPNTLAILRATFPPERLQQAVGAWAGSSAIALASGPIVGGLLVEHVTWESIFLVNLVLGGIALTVGWRVITESRGDGAGTRFDLLGVVLLSGGLFALVWGVIKAQDHGWSSAYTLGFLAAAAALLAGWLAWEARGARSPLVPLELFRSRTLAAGVALVMLAIFALFGVLFFLTLYLQRVHGFSPVEAGVRLLPLTCLVAVSAPIGGQLVARFGPRPSMVAGMLLVAGGLVGLSGVAPDSGYGALWPCFVLVGLGVGQVQTSASQAILGSAPERLAGIAGGLQTTMLQVGGALGTSVLGSILASRVADDYPGELVARGVAAGPAGLLSERTADAVAQGVVPVPPQVPPGMAGRVTEAGMQAFTNGLGTVMLVGASVALTGALIGLLAGQRTTRTRVAARPEIRQASSRNAATSSPDARSVTPS